MEQWKDSLQTALDDRLNAAFAELAESNADVRDAMKQQLEASILLKDHPKYDDELKQIADSYFDAAFIRRIQSAYVHPGRQGLCDSFKGAWRNQVAQAMMSVLF